jgi:hypothetical protein
VRLKVRHLLETEPLSVCKDPALEILLAVAPVEGVLVVFSLPVNVGLLTVPVTEVTVCVCVEEATVAAAVEVFGMVAAVPVKVGAAKFPLKATLCVCVL